MSTLIYLEGTSVLNEESCLNTTQTLLKGSDAVAITIRDGHESVCDRHWDNIACWPPSVGGRTLAMPCNSFKAFSDLITSTNPRILQSQMKGFAYLKCNTQGFWDNRTNYEECTNFLNDILSEEETRKHVRHAVSVITFSLCLASMVFLLISLGIYSFFKSLQSDRLKVHRNFMLALMIRYAVSVIYYEPFIYGDPSPNVWFKVYGKGILCKGILVLLMFGYIAPVFWMFVEGMYLHSRITTNVFESKAPMKRFYLIGWCIPFLCVLAWTIAMSVMVEDEKESCNSLPPKSIPEEEEEEATTSSDCPKIYSCWEGYNEMPYSYILSIPMTIALIINLLFLINIVRIVIKKHRGRTCGSHGSQGIMLRNSGGSRSSTFNITSPQYVQSDNIRIRKAVRVTLILFPLLGITHLLFFINPRNGTHDKIYMLFNASLQSSQGIFLAVLYCFITSEVRDAFRRHFHRISTRYEMRRETIRRNDNMRRNLWNSSILSEATLSRGKTHATNAVSHPSLRKNFSDNILRNDEGEPTVIMEMVEIK